MEAPFDWGVMAKSLDPEVEESAGEKSTLARTVS